MSAAVRRLPNSSLRWESSFVFSFFLDDEGPVPTNSSNSS